MFYYKLVAELENAVKVAHCILGGWPNADQNPGKDSRQCPLMKGSGKVREKCPELGN